MGVFKLDEATVFGTALTDAQVATLALSANTPPPAGASALDATFTGIECDNFDTISFTAKGTAKRQKVSSRIPNRFRKRILKISLRIYRDTVVHGLYISGAQKRRRP